LTLVKICRILVYMRCFTSRIALDLVRDAWKSYSLEYNTTQITQLFAKNDIAA